MKKRPEYPSLLWPQKAHFKEDKALGKPLPKRFPPLKRNAKTRIQQLLTRRSGQEYDIQHGIAFAVLEIWKVVEQIRDNARRR